jgi:ribosomal protein S4
LVRVGFLKNIIQSNFLISKGAIFINNKTVINSSKHIKINDILQISYFMMFFLKFLYKKKKNLNFFLIQKLLKKKKSPFYLEINEKIKTCLLLYKPLPKKNDLRSIKKFNFFFYKFLFLFLKKKTF